MHFFLLLGLALLGCGGTAETTVVPNSRLHSVAVRSESFEDLSFLGPLLASKRVVQLGESSHGVREYNLVKSRLVRYLHEKLGFQVIVFESALYQCWDADLLAAEAEAVDTLQDCLFGVWHTQELVPLFEHLKESQNDPEPLTLAGFDVQPIGRNKADRPRFLADVVAVIDADYAERVLDLDTEFLEVYSRKSRERRAFFRGEGAGMKASYDNLVAFLDQHRERLMERFAGSPEAQAPLIARQTAASMASYIAQQTAPDTRSYVERRDAGMAENLLFIVEQLFPDDKVIVWGHNFHLRHDNSAIEPPDDMFPDVPARTMGSWVKERLGDQLYTIGFYVYEGTAVDNSRTVYEIERPREGSLEATLHRLAQEYEPGHGVFIDLSRVPSRGPLAGLSESMSARHHGTTPLTLVPDEQYDGVILLPSASPPEFLY